MFDFSFIFVLLNSWLVIRICRNNKVHLLLKILICISFFGWNAAPALLMYISAISGANVVPNDTYIRCSYYNQVYLFFAYSLSLMWIKRRKPLKLLTNIDFQGSQRVFNILFYSSVVLLIYRIGKLIYAASSYLESNDISNLTAMGPIDYISGLGVSFIVGSILLFRDRIKQPAFYIGTGSLFLYYLIHTLRGGRIYFFGIIIIVLYYAIQKKSKIHLIFGCVLALLALSLLPVLSTLRGTQQIKISDIRSTKSPLSYTMIMSEVLTKTNSVMYGSYLIDKDGIGNWDGKMYTSTIYALVPRIIFPSKPEPGSVDGTQYGLPARASSSYSAIGEYNDIGNNGVPASLSSLWGGGWLAYVIEILFTAFLIFFINGVFHSNKPIFAGFIFSLLSFPVGILEIPLPTILTAVQRDVVVYFVLFIILSPAFKRDRFYRNIN